MKNTSSSILLSIMGAAMLAACTSTPNAVMVVKPQKDFEIEFLVAGPKLNIFTANNGCRKADKGCMRVPAVNSAMVTFKFQNNQNYPCATNPNSHYISKIALADFPKDFGKPVKSWIELDFPAVDPANGELWNHKPGTPVQSVKIQDLNDHKGVAYYQITVQKCTTDAPTSTDPRFENEG